MSKQDRQGARSFSDLEYLRLAFDKSFAEIMGVATDARRIAEDVRSNYSELDHESVFNLLTNHGEMQGLYEQDGNIYFNASYIKTGTLSADFVKTGILKSSNYRTYSDGSAVLGMSIDLDNGTINTPKFSVNNLGEIRAEGGTIGGFNITTSGLSKSLLIDTVTEEIKISPQEIKTTSTDLTFNLSARLAHGIVEVEVNHNTDTFGGTFFKYIENGQTYFLVIDPATMTVKVTR
jgi:hypothetical protein